MSFLDDLAKAAPKIDQRLVQEIRNQTDDLRKKIDNAELNRMTQADYVGYCYILGQAGKHHIDASGLKQQLDASARSRGLDIIVSIDPTIAGSSASTQPARPVAARPPLAIEAAPPATNAYGMPPVSRGSHPSRSRGGRGGPVARGTRTPVSTSQGHHTTTSGRVAKGSHNKQAVRGGSGGGRGKRGPRRGRGGGRGHGPSSQPGTPSSA